MKIILSLVLMLLFISAFPQRVARKAPNKGSQTYHEYRRRLTVPPYGIVKVRALLPSIKTDQDDNEALPAKERVTNKISLITIIATG